MIERLPAVGLPQKILSCLDEDSKKNAQQACRAWHSLVEDSYTPVQSELKGAWRGCLKGRAIEAATPPAGEAKTSLAARLSELCRQENKSVAGQMPLGHYDRLSQLVQFCRRSETLRGALDAFSSRQEAAHVISLHELSSVVPEWMVDIICDYGPWTEKTRPHYIVDGLLDKKKILVDARRMKKPVAWGDDDEGHIFLCLRMRGEARDGSVSHPITLSFNFKPGLTGEENSAEEGWKSFTYHWLPGREVWYSDSSYRRDFPGKQAAIRMARDLAQHGESRRFENMVMHSDFRLWEVQRFVLA